MVKVIFLTEGDVGNNLVSEAKGTASGCVYSKLSDAKWTHAAKLKNTIYDTTEDDLKEETFTPFTGIVSTQSDNLNLRNKPLGSKIDSIPKGTMLAITAKDGDWYQTTYNGTIGWVSTQYIKEVNTPAEEKNYSYTIRNVPESFMKEFESYLSQHNLNFTIGGD